MIEQKSAVCGAKWNFCRFQAMCLVLEECLHWWQGVHLLPLVPGPEGPWGPAAGALIRHTSSTSTKMRWKEFDIHISRFSQEQENQKYHIFHVASKKIWWNLRYVIKNHCLGPRGCEKESPAEVKNDYLGIHNSSSSAMRERVPFTSVPHRLKKNVRKCTQENLS